MKSYVLLGAGNVGWSLAPALARLGRLEAVWSAGEANARTLAAETGAPLALWGDDGLRQLPRADVAVISVRDDAVAPLASRLAELHDGGGDTLWVHTAGSVGLAALMPLGRRTGVVYPLQTFTRGRVINLATVPIFAEGHSDALALARALSPLAVEADGELRATLHLAAVFACNFTNCLWAKADALLRGKGLGFATLEPLVGEMLRKAALIGPEAAQTGPAARGDTRLVEQQLQALRVIASESPALADAPAIYTLLTQAITDAR